MSQSAMQKNWVAIFKVKVIERAYIHNKSITVLIIFSKLMILLVTKLGLMVHHHKPRCSVKKVDCCIQYQGHSDGSKCQHLFALTISSEPPNIFLPNLVF